MVVGYGAGQSKPAVFSLERRFVDLMVAHAREEAPNECCGLLAGVGGKVSRLYRTTNAERSPLRYSMEPRELLGILKELDAEVWDIIAIYHSHTHTQAYPSPTDLRLAFWPDSLYIIISLQDAAQPVVRAFRISEGVIKEEEVRIVAG